eukprot:2428951-Pyramimonas_sp.AAC.1
MFLGVQRACSYSTAKEGMLVKLPAGGREPGICDGFLKAGGGARDAAGAGFGRRVRCGSDTAPE